MKLLAIGDFHGKFPEKLIKIAKRKDIDLILSSGDFPDTEKIRKIIFKHWTDKKWYEVTGMKKARKMVKESFDSGLKILKKLDSIGKSTYIVWGNSDFYKATNEPKLISPGFYEDKIKIMKHIELIDRKRVKLDGIEILGHGGYLDATEFIKKEALKEDEKEYKKRLKRYYMSKDKLFKLFIRKKPKKGFIFLTHYTPYGIFDKVKFKESPMHGKHMGFQPYNEIIKRYQPSIMICGHMHEYHGKQKLGKTLVVNSGDASEGRAVIIEIDEKNKKIASVKLIK